MLKSLTLIILPKLITQVRKHITAFGTVDFPTITVSVNKTSGRCVLRSEFLAIHSVSLEVHLTNV